MNIRSRPALSALTLLTAAAAGCSSPPPVVTPAERFDALEKRLFDAERFALDYRIESRGEFEVDARGVLTVDGDAVEISFRGTFGGQAKRGLFYGDASRMTLDTDEADFEREAPEDLREGVVLGLTRMGLLHNLFVLANGGAPEGTDGNAREWARVEELSTEPDGSLAFAIIVADRRSATATLRIDDESGLPASRTQTVQFGEDRQMVVNEHYSTHDEEPAVSTGDKPIEID